MGNMTSTLDGFDAEHRVGPRIYFEDTDLRPPFYFDTVSNIILRNVEGELASGTLSNNCQIVVNETTGLVLESSSLTACEYADISPCPHQVYYYSPYDY